MQINIEHNNMVNIYSVRLQNDQNSNTFAKIPFEINNNIGTTTKVNNMCLANHDEEYCLWMFQ